MNGQSNKDLWRRGRGAFASRAGRLSAVGRFSLLAVGCLAWVAPDANAQESDLPAEMAAAAAVRLPEDPAAVVAVVGQSRILLGDLMPKVDSRIRSMVDASPRPVPEQEIHPVRVMIFRGLLRQTISGKMMRESFLLDQVATESAEKRREAAQMMESRARKVFVETRLPELKKTLETDDLQELDRKLREQGSSLQSLQYEFVDQMLSFLYRQSKISDSPEVSLAEIYGYYLRHQDEFRHQARARWEQLTVWYRHFPDRDAARKEIWEMLQEARFGGSMQAVARDRSQEPFAKEGGLHDWTNQGSLASEVLDRVIFDPAIPLNQISDVIEDKDGLHVVRVLDRQPAGVTPVGEVQEQIREKIRQRKIAEAEDRALAEMKDRVPVWTMFPEDIPGAMPLPRIASPGQPLRR